MTYYMAINVNVLYNVAHHHAGGGYVFEVTRRQQAVILIVAALFVFVAGFKYSQWKAKPQEAETVARARPLQQDMPAGQVVIHIAGSVEKPGVYSLGQGSRIADALEKAGALSETDLQAINLAAPLKDGQKIFIPAKPIEGQLVGAGQAVSAGAAAPGAASPGIKANAGAAASKSSTTGTGPGHRVNINTAGQAELETLPGIGPSLAGSIIKYREESGGFAGEEDLKNVPGIGEKRFQQLEGLVSVY